MTAIRGVRISAAVVRLGGTLSGEHGDGRLRAGLLPAVYGDEIMDLFRRVKHSFDPLGILAPGVILPSGDPPIQQLKVGPHAVGLPDDIARANSRVSNGCRRCNRRRSGRILVIESELVAGCRSNPESEH